MGGYIRTGFDLKNRYQDHSIQKLKNIVKNSKGIINNYQVDLERISQISFDKNSQREDIISSIDDLILVKEKLKKEYKDLGKPEKEKLQVLYDKKFKSFVETNLPIKSAPPKDYLDRLEYDLDSIGDVLHPYKYFFLIQYDNNYDYNLIRQNMYLPSKKDKISYSTTHNDNGQEQKPLKPIQGMDFNFEFIDLIFNGHFGEIEDDYKSYKEYLKLTINAYVLLATKYCKSDQINATEAIKWITKKETLQYGSKINEEIIGVSDVLYVDLKLSNLYSWSQNINPLFYAGVGPQRYKEIKSDIIENLYQLFDKYGCQSDELKQFLENMIRIGNGKESVQYEFSEWNQLNSDDRFFSKEYYETLRRNSLIDEKKIFKPFGQYYKSSYYNYSSERMEKAQVATAKLIELAKRNGIPENQITQAIFSGKLNPFFEDLRLAFEGLYTTIDEQDLPLGWYWKFKFLGEIKNGEKVPPVRVARYFMEEQRIKRWNERFGKITDLPKVNTYLRGEKVKVFGREFAFRIFCMERDRYKELEKESSLVSILDTLEKQSYEEAVQWLEQKGN